MKRSITAVAALLIVATCLSTAHAQTTLYWDLNGTTAGVGDVGGFQDGAWNGAATTWNTDPTGGAAGTVGGPFASGDIAVFSAGTDATDGIVTVTAQTIGGMTVEEGRMEFVGAGGIIAGATVPIRVNQGAVMQYANQNVFTIPQLHELTLDGGTIRNTVVGLGSGIWSSGTGQGTPAAPSPGTRILLTSNGGTLDTPNGGSAADPINGAYSIMLYGVQSATVKADSVIGMTPGTTSATLRKTGHGEFRGFHDWTFTSLIVDEGLYRINGTGGTDTGFGAATGTVTVAGGAVENTTNGASVGTTANLTGDAGGVGPSPATRSWVLSGAGDTPDSMFVVNANWAIQGNISGAGGLMLNGWSRNDGAGSATVSNPIGTQNELRLSGTNTYGGKTTINFGTVVAQGGNAIPNASPVVISTRSLWGQSIDPAGNRTFNTAGLRVDASETVGSLAGGVTTAGTLVRGTVNINGPAVTLTTGADNSSTTFSGTVSGTGSLAKSGTGTFTMDGNKTYTGDTSVLGGTLSTNSASLADLADVYLTTGNFFNLNFAGTDTIDSLFIDGIGQAVGTWGGAGWGATNISALLTGTGTLTVSTLPGPVGVQGDYNNNGVVDAADYVLWRNGGPIQNEVTGVTTGLVTPEDYDAWRARFGNNSGSGSGQGAAVPEPTSLVLVFASLIGLTLTGRRSR